MVGIRHRLLGLSLARKLSAIGVLATSASLALAVAPNPFSGHTDLSFSLPRAGAVSLRVYNVAGQLVATLLEGEGRAGVNHVSFSARNLPAGMYFTRLQLGHEQVVRSVILVP